jgi:DNA-directed RNA polymerase subunit omega
MARITVEDCLKIVGDSNRFNLIHLAVQRIKQHRQGEPFVVEGKNKEVVMTLREIASGKVTMENIDAIASVGDDLALAQEIAATEENPA